MPASALLWAVLIALAALGCEHRGSPVDNGEFDRGTSGWGLWVESEDVAVRMDVVGGPEARRPAEKPGRAEPAVLVVEIDGEVPGSRVEVQQVGVGLRRDVRYELSLWARAVPSRQARVVVNHRQPPWTTYGVSNLALTEEWQRFVLTFSPPTDDQRAGFYVELNGEPGKVWLDAFDLQEIRPSE